MRAYSYFSLDRFPAEPTFETQTQQELVWTAETTQFRHVGDLDCGFHEYAVRHFSRVRFRGTPYHHSERIEEVTEAHDFEAYVRSDRSFILMRYGKKVSQEAAKRLRLLEPPVNATKQRLDLKALIRLAHFQHLYGTYFSNMQVPNLKSSAMFGPDVNDNEFFDTFNRLGELSAIITEVDHDGVAHRIMITQDFGIGFYKDGPAATQLEAVLRIKPYLDEVTILPRDDDNDAPPFDELQEDLFDDE